METKSELTSQNSYMSDFVKTDNILNDMCGIIAFIPSISTTIEYIQYY